MNEEIEELGDRIDGLRLIISILVAAMPDPMDVMSKPQAAEMLARQRNLPTGTIMELADLREALDDM